MKKIINAPENYTDDMLKGIYAAHPDMVKYAADDLRCYCTAKKVPGKVAIITGSTPLMNEAWGHSNLMTSRSLQKLGEIGGPRCCKRNSYMSILTAIDYVEELTGIRMHRSGITCTHMSSNSQCIGGRCPFYVK